jgi:precorrin-6A/cobalt-precorrin-6A reductase
MPDRKPQRLLILGGTAEAAELARAVAGRFPRLAVVTSLAGRLAPSQDMPGGLRIGGFGGMAGLFDYLWDEGIDLVVDATHPFAYAISHSAATACAAVGVPRLLLLRPPWQPQAGDDWLQVDSFADAADAVARCSKRAFLTTGPTDLAAFGWITGVWFLVRLFERPEALLPLNRYAVVVSRPPFTFDSERDLMHRHAVDTLVTKQSGGPAAAKLSAARQLGLRVIVIARPPQPEGDKVETVEAAFAWIGARL